MSDKRLQINPEPLKPKPIPKCRKCGRYALRGCVCLEPDFSAAGTKEPDGS